MYGAPGSMNLTPLKHGGSREVGHVARWVRPLRAAGPLARVLRPRTRVRLQPAVDLDERIDAVWTAAKSELRLAAIRDAAFYTWRFREAPAQRQPTYVIVEDGEPIGACALERLDDAHRIVDLLAVPGAWHRCLAGIVRFLADSSDARVIDLKLFALSGRKHFMWRSGFVERESKPFLCMIPKGGDRRFVDPTRWYYSQADSDLDDHR
jgi:hypothetical protein